MSTVLLIMLGGTIGFIAAALFKSAGSADERIESLQAEEDKVNNFSMSSSKLNSDIVKESKKETLI